MKHPYEEFPTGSKSPYNMSRGAHPGAVLLSPQSSAINNNSNSNNSNNSVSNNGNNNQCNSSVATNVLSPQTHSMSLNDMLDQQSFMLETTRTRPQPLQQQQQQQAPLPSLNIQTVSSTAAGSAIVSPMMQSPKTLQSTLSSTSMYLDSFQRSSNNILGIPSQSGSMPLPQSRQPQQHSQPLPQKNDSNIGVNFSQDINQLCSWISMLTSSQQNTVMDNILSILNDDVLKYTKLKLDTLTNTSFISPPLPAIASPIPNRDDTQILNIDSVFSSSPITNDSENTDNLLYQNWSPQPHSIPIIQPIYDSINDPSQRSKSAEPHVTSSPNLIPVQKQYNNGISTKYKKLPSDNSNYLSHSLSTSHSFFQPKKRSNMGNEYNSHHHHSLHHPLHNTTSYFSNTPRSSGTELSKSNQNMFNNANSHPNTSAAATSVTSASTSSNGNTPLSSNSSMNPKSLTDPKLLKNVPMWLKSLRLHKYSDALSETPWIELVYLDDETLEKKGVLALGARRKLLKAFSIVIDYKERDLIDRSAY
ncbi:Vts1p [Saccharomyces cerevisiae x Saccharomyces kudriavzevii VIN7]|uniref:RNA-binding protein VTS1 n=1 Tax=Saccharomyces cerevisiae x Saccharomyces kudriavzevii (strain VIN7) TaxID=1095631 RepID=H0H1M1_SACCK|nr:Vts1p [Saccharomyces cerevisiae x Saccharomyces kudriavzevii VIN7]